MSSMVGFGVLVVILFISGVMRLMAPRSDADTHRTTALPVDATIQSSMPAAEATASQTPSTSIADKRTVISLSPQELVRLFNTGGTSAQANRLIQPYVGKKMEVSGEVDDVTHFGPDMNQVCFTGLMGLGISTLMYFREKWADEVSMLVKGEKITVRGKFDGIVYRDTVRLVDCELLVKRRS